MHTNQVKRENFMKFYENEGGWAHDRRHIVYVAATTWFHPSHLLEVISLPHKPVSKSPLKQYHFVRTLVIGAHRAQSMTRCDNNSALLIWDSHIKGIFLYPS